MDKEKPTEKYIPPHRRSQKNSSAIPTNNNVNQPIKKNQPMRFFTNHAVSRQEQRKITSLAIEKVLNDGEKLENKESTTYINATTEIVVAKNGAVITVKDNKRNKNYDLLNKSKAQEKKLLGEIADSRNNDVAMCELAEIYLNAELGNREVEKAYALLLQAAAKRNSHAMCLLADLHETGDLGKIDLAEAEAWLEKAVEQNNRYALTELGQRYLKKYLALNEADKKDETNKKIWQKASHYLERSAGKGSSSAMWQIAQNYEKGQGVEKDINKAITIYSEAAKLGSYASLRDLQRLVNIEKFVAEDFEKILATASDYIAKTSSQLAVDIGLAQIKGQLGTNQQRGFAMLEKAAEKNNERAMRSLAKCYRDGIGCEPDPMRSQAWFAKLKILYEKAIARGNIVAILDLADLFLKGAFGKIDVESAEKLYIKAANEGDMDSIYYLGTLYIKGYLGDHDPAKGVIWINKAIAMWSEKGAMGNVDAMKSLIRLYLNKQLGFKNYQKAAQWLALLAKKESSYALHKLISLYLRRKITLENNEIKAIFSAEILALIKSNAEAEDIMALRMLMALRHAKYLPQQMQTENDNHWAKKLEGALIKNGKKEAAASLFLGKLYKKEKGPLLKNLQQAVIWLCQANDLPASEAVEAEAEQELESMLKYKNWQENESKQIIAGLLEYAEQAPKRRPYNIGRILGDFYSNGILVEVNFEAACKWYEAAVLFHNAKAMYCLGRLYQTKMPRAELSMKAIKLLISAAHKDNKEAIAYLNELAESLEEKPELKEAFIELINQYKQDKLAMENILKEMKPKNIVNSWRKNPDSLYKLGKQYKEGTDDKAKDYVQAAFWLRKAAEKNHAEAAFELAQLYNTGQLGKNVRPAAIVFFKLAAKQSHLGAVKALVDIYSNATLTDNDPKQIAKWQTRETELVKTFDP